MMANIRCGFMQLYVCVSCVFLFVQSDRCMMQSGCRLSVVDCKGLWSSEQRKRLLSFHTLCECVPLFVDPHHFQPHYVTQIYFFYQDYLFVLHYIFCVYITVLNDGKRVGVVGLSELDCVPVAVWSHDTITGSH